MYCPEGVLGQRIYGAKTPKQGTACQSILNVINNSRSLTQPKSKAYLRSSRLASPTESTASPEPTLKTPGCKAGNRSSPDHPP